MTSLDYVQILLFVFLLISCVPLLGTYMAGLFRGKRTFLHPVLFPLEKLTYKMGGISTTQEMNWRTYLKALLLFNFWGCLVLFLILLLQPFLPLNPESMPPIPWVLALNIAISFTTNTGWQAYAGETTLSYFSQMCGLTVQNFLAAATGMATLLALIRGITQKTCEGVGNFWVDLVRTTLYVLFPLAFIVALLLVSQGVIQSLSPYVKATTLEQKEQILPMGPVASQAAIKLLGSGGGGFFNTNCAHPYENPNARTNFLELFCLLLIPASTLYMYGVLAGSRKHGWLLFSTVFLIWFGSLIFALIAENRANPLLDASPLLEGKEVRIGVMNSILWSISTTASANGSVNTMLSSLSPLAGGLALFNLLLGELVFGGVGVGLCALLMFVLLALFFAGLMVGRTPEYLGKRIEKTEMQWVSLALLLPSVLVLLCSALTISLFKANSHLLHRGPHYLSEVLFAFASTTGNNGSAFAKLEGNTLYYHLTLSLCMLLGRLGIIFPSLAIAGALCKKNISPPSLGVFSTNTVLFVFLLLATIVVAGALSYFPALCLGPILENFLLYEGRTF